MPISDRSRKILWGRSGNRCAICRRPLVAAPTPDDSAAVVGDECHIAARSPGGPRASAITGIEIDAEDNLVLLCRVDHKRVDDQPNYFTAERLRAIKMAHESWVHATLSTLPPQTLAVRIRRKDARPTSLPLVTSGSTLLAIVLGAMAYDFDNDDLRTEDEVELISSFSQSVHDYGELGDDLEPSDRVRARFELGKMLDELTQAGFFVYGAQAHHVIEGGVMPPSNWEIATIRVKRAEDVIQEAGDVLKAVEERPYGAPAT